MRASQTRHTRKYSGVGNIRGLAEGVLVLKLLICPVCIAVCFCFGWPCRERKELLGVTDFLRAAGGGGRKCQFFVSRVHRNSGDTICSVECTKPQL